MYFQVLFCTIRLFFDVKLIANKRGAPEQNPSFATSKTLEDRMIFNPSSSTQSISKKFMESSR